MTTGHTYGNIYACGSGPVLAGDLHIHHGQQPPDIGEILKNSLTFDRWDARLRNVTPALNQTCEWVFAHEKFRAWLDPHQFSQHGGFLWLKGKPGSGKSTIMKEMVKWTKKQKPGTTILSYFFNARSPHELEKSSLGLYRTLSYQLLTAYPDKLTMFSQMFSGKVREAMLKEAWTDAELHNFLLSLVEERLRPLIIFVDALDEGREDDIRQMIEVLVELGHRSQIKDNTILVCLSSRHYPNVTIDKSLSIVVQDQVGHKQDIERYISEKLKIGSTIEMHSFRYRIRNRSQGVFLWVVLVVTLLKKRYDNGYSRDECVKALEQAPVDLHDIFNDLLMGDSHRVNNNDSQEAQECITLFRWVLFSLRRVQLQELIIAIQVSLNPAENEQVTSNSEDCCTQDAAMMLRRIIRLSRGLLELVGSSDESKGSFSSESVVQFIHETARDFLLGKHQETTPEHNITASDDFKAHFEAHKCHAAIAKDCLMRIIALSKRPDSSTKQPILADYAARYWWQHARAAGEQAGEEVLTLATKLCLTQNHLLTWVRNYDIDSNKDPNRPSSVRMKLAPPLYYACMTGYGDLVRVMLDHGVDVNGQGGSYGHALQAASAEGHEMVVHILLRKGANVNAQGGIYDNALRAALLKGNEKILRILLENGADVNFQGGKYGNALRTASSIGDKQAVQILLDYGADINAGARCGTALNAALAEGHEEVVQLLLDKGANVSAQAADGFALQVASAKGHENLVQALLQKGADVNAQAWNGTALYAASIKGRLKVVQMLLRAGANADAYSRDYGSALQAASSEGHKRIVQILLENGANVNASGGYYGDALQAASYRGYEKIVWMLLENGADIDSNRGHYGYALQAASAGPSETVVQMLLGVGADVNACGGYYYTALQAASFRGSKKRVQALLDRNANVNTNGGHYGTALQAAAAMGHQKVVQLLLDTNADVNAPGGHFGSVLQAASAEASEELVRMLLDNGANVNTHGGYYGSALQAASAAGSERVVELLLDRNADVNAPGGYFGCALQAASARATDSEGLVRMLLDNGANVNIHGGYYGSALQAASAKGKQIVVQMLLNKGADVNAPGGSYGNAVREALQRGHTELVQLLKTHGAHLYYYQYSQMLYSASENGRKSTVKQLLKKGADPNAFRGMLGSSLQAAISLGHEDVVQVLREHGAEQ